MGTGVRVLEQGAAAERPVVEVLARAFRDNPLDVAVIGRSPRHRLRSNRAGMRASLVAARGIALRLVAGPEPAGALLATPPDRHPLPQPPLGEQLRCLLWQGPRVISRWAHVGSELLPHHPLERHWYLGLLGVEPRRQGHGVGARLMEAFVERVEADRLPAYLETDRPENVRFYRRFGFEVASELEILGVPVATMRRAAAGARPESGGRSEKGG